MNEIVTRTQAQLPDTIEAVDEVIKDLERFFDDIFKKEQDEDVD